MKKVSSDGTHLVQQKWKGVRPWIFQMQSLRICIYLWVLTSILGRNWSARKDDLFYTGDYSKGD
jgi:hypothetical protein